MKSILVIDTPKDCYDCPCYYEDRDMCEVLNRKAKADSGNPSWCPLSHPLKRVNSDFYIYDTRYLFDHLDREIELMKGTRDFVKAREEE